jgi:hypothetical protein
MVISNINFACVHSSNVDHSANKSAASVGGDDGTAW